MDIIQAPQQIEPQTTIATEINILAFVSWLFLIGSLIFQVNAILELTKSISLHAVLHFSVGLLFTIGSLLFVVYDAQQK